MRIPFSKHRVEERKQLDGVAWLVWLIPVAAGVVGLSIIANLMLHQGPTIDIGFRTGEGIEAGKTVVKYKDVQIGLVRSVRLAKDRSRVHVSVQLRGDTAAFALKDSRFWVVRPRVDTTGISGFGTLLSGAYIAADAGVSDDKETAFTALDGPPIVTRDAPGSQFVLRGTDTGSLDVGSAVYFRRIKIGQVSARDLDGDGRGVTLRIFVRAPYDRFVFANTRFWHASGLDLRFSASGATLRTQSLSSILQGGIAFRTPDDTPGPIASENTSFSLAADETAALKLPDGPAHTLLLYFDQSLRGLGPGAAVDFRGVAIGEVKSIGIEFDRRLRAFRMPVLVQVFPDRLRRGVAAAPAAPEPAEDDVRRIMIARGLRAQLRTGNLLTGQLYVAVDFFPKAPAVKVDVSGNPLELPTVPNGLDELQMQAQEIVAKVNKVPFAQLATELQRTLLQTNSTLASTEQLSKTLNHDLVPEVTAAIRDARATLNNVEKTLAQDSPLQQDMRQALRELGRAAASLRVLTDYLERHPESLLRSKPDDSK